MGSNQNHINSFVENLKKTFILKSGRSQSRVFISAVFFKEPGDL